MSSEANEFGRMRSRGKGGVTTIGPGAAVLIGTGGGVLLTGAGEGVLQIVVNDGGVRVVRDSERTRFEVGEAVGF